MRHNPSLNFLSVAAQLYLKENERPIPAVCCTMMNRRLDMVPVAVHNALCCKHTHITLLRAAWSHTVMMQMWCSRRQADVRDIKKYCSAVVLECLPPLW